MAMLDRGRMLKVESRDWFDRLRKMDEAHAEGLDGDEKLIRQFLRGDAEGPITDRRDHTRLERALLGEQATAAVPSIVPTRGWKPTKERGT
jgi:hypothetical protein